MLATASETEYRTCIGPCRRKLRLDTENFQTAGVKMSREQRWHARCRLCRRLQVEESRQRLRDAGLPARKPTAPAADRPMLPALAAGERIFAAISRQSLERGVRPMDRWEVFAERSGIAKNGSIAQRIVFAWRCGERKDVQAATVVDALGAVDLHLCDVYDDDLLAARLPPVVMD